MILGITGGSGCGKTTLLNLLREQGSLVLDCDEIYHALLETDENLLRDIDHAFPGTVIDGVLQRKKLGAIVFADEKALLVLNAITHSAVKQEVLRLLAKNPSHAAIDAIGLFEGGLAELCDTTVAILAPREARIQRLVARDGISESYAAARIAAQHSDEWFRSHCRHILMNDGSMEAFEAVCLAFLDCIGIIKPVDTIKIEGA